VFSPVTFSFSPKFYGHGRAAPNRALREVVLKRAGELYAVPPWLLLLTPSFVSRKYLFPLVEAAWRALLERSPLPGFSGVRFFLPRFSLAFRSNPVRRATSSSSRSSDTRRTFSRAKLFLTSLASSLLYRSSPSPPSFDSSVRRDVLFDSRTSSSDRDPSVFPLPVSVAHCARDRLRPSP